MTGTIPRPLFDGTYFHPVEEGLEDAFEDARIKCIEVGQTSPIANQPIREIQFRSRTGVSILAIQRGDRTISNPDPDTDIQPGDMLVVVGTGEAYDELDEFLTARLASEPARETTPFISPEDG